MNAHQRRVRRRKMGIRPPYTCLWCSASLPTWDAPCGCPKGARLRKPFLDMTLYDLAGGAWERGLELTFDIVPLDSDDHKRPVKTRQERER